MLDISVFFFSYLFRSLVSMVLIDCNTLKVKRSFCSFFIGPMARQVSTDPELLPCINKFKMKTKKEKLFA